MERAILVSVMEKGSQARRQHEFELVELQGLVEAAGAFVIGQFTQGRDPGTRGLGRGAFEDLKQHVEGLSADLVVSNEELSPSLLAVWQRGLGGEVRVVDRTQVILDIFARRATSREGQMQVEMAQYRYLLPRLGGMGRSDREGGGIGTRGPGESPLERDRRAIAKHLTALEHDLAALDRERSLRRARRRRTELPVVALVGYTNVGKSTLFRRLTGRDHRVDDALFVTLDPTVHRVTVPELGPALLVDTVGFVDRLPHQLVAAFRSTLDEVRAADLILWVLGVEDLMMPRRERAVQETLSALGADGIPTLRLYNQWDRVSVESPRPDDGITLSALKDRDLHEVWRVIAEGLKGFYLEAWCYLPWSEDEGWKHIYREMTILARMDQEGGARVRLRGSRKAFDQLENLGAGLLFSNSSRER